MSGSYQQLVYGLRPVTELETDSETVSHRQNNSGRVSVKEVDGDPASAKQLVYFAPCFFNSCEAQSHRVQGISRR